MVRFTVQLGQDEAKAKPTKVTKLCFSMANVDGGLSDDLSEFVPNVCTNSPASGYYNKTHYFCNIRMF